MRYNHKTSRSITHTRLHDGTTNRHIVGIYLKLLVYVFAHMKATCARNNIDKTYITLHVYEKIVEGHRRDRVMFNNVRSLYHKTYSATCNKAPLSKYDHTRYYTNNYMPYPEGHLRMSDINSHTSITAVSAMRSLQHMYLPSLTALYC